MAESPDHEIQMELQVEQEQSQGAFGLIYF
jgi:hypothetical protein